MAQAVICLAGFSMFGLFVLIILLIWKRNSPVIRAASWMFSLLILFGGELTLASIIMRASARPVVGWLDCMGTCKPALMQQATIDETS